MLKETYIPDFNFHRLGRCGEGWIYGTYKDSIVYNTNHIVQHRVRPPAPLAYSPTSLPRKFRCSASQQIEERYVTGVAESCDGLVTHVRTDTYRKHAIFVPENAMQTIVVNIPETDYALKLRQRIEAMSVNLAESCAEYRETAEMFGVCAKALFGAVKAAKKGAFDKTLTLKQVAETELISSWGIAPLLGDLGSAQQRLAKKLEVGEVFRVTAKGKLNYDTTWNYCKVQCKKIERGTVYVQVTPDYDPLHFGSLPELAWELVPFSPVVDWMTPLGDALRVMDALRGFSLKASTKAQMIKARFEGVSPTTANYVIVRPFSGHYESYQRYVLPFVEMPRVPLYRPSKSCKAIMHGLSLLTILHKGR